MKKNNIFKSIPKVLSKENICKISKLKNEIKLMLHFILKSYEAFKKISIPLFGPDLSKLDFNSYTYFINHGETNNKWCDVPKNIQNDFDKIGLQEAEKKHLLGLRAQYNSEAIYFYILDDIKKME